jgi:hypothetical protein
MMNKSSWAAVSILLGTHNVMDQIDTLPERLRNEMMDRVMKEPERAYTEYVESEWFLDLLKGD